MNDRIYLDYHASTPVDPRVADVVRHFMVQEFGNASSADHIFGDRAEAAVMTAAEQVAALVGVQADEIIFTSGATEGANLSIRGFVNWLFERQKGKKVRVGYAAVEHSAVMQTCKSLAQSGLAELAVIGVDQNGMLDWPQLEQTLNHGLDLLCVMTANNIVGNIYPVGPIATLAHEHGVYFFSDATQAVGHIPVDLGTWGVDSAVMSAHKLHGPKGVGALYLRRPLQFTPLFTGGGQQRGIRPGTLNVPGIAGFGKACQLRLQEAAEDSIRVESLRDRARERIRSALPEAVFFGSEETLPGNLSFSVPGIPNKAVVARIRHKVAVSTGAACSSGLEAPSHVLQAMNVPPEMAEGHIRIGVGKFNDAEDVDRAVDLLVEAVRSVKNVMVQAS